MAELKLRIFLSLLLCGTLLGLFLITARTLAGLEYAMNRIEELMGMELGMARRKIERGKEAARKTATQSGRHARDDLPLNIPFLERLGKEKPKSG